VYVTTEVDLEWSDGTMATYEVGAELDPEGDAVYVGEPDISAPDCSLDTSRLVACQEPGGLADGWSEVVETALYEAYVGILEDRCDMWEDR
jgi:hypothetical protein